MNECTIHFPTVHTALETSYASSPETPDASMRALASLARARIVPSSRARIRVVGRRPSAVRRRPSVGRPETEPPFVRSFVRSFELKIPRPSVVVGLGTASHASACPTRFYVRRSSTRPSRRTVASRLTVASPSSYLSSRVLNPLKRPCARECGRRERRRPHSIDSRPILSTGRVEYDVRTRSGARSARV